LKQLAQETLLGHGEMTHDLKRDKTLFSQIVSSGSLQRLGMGS
jgi:hypothetical protein